MASLFRATARSEEILMRDHAEVLRALGAEPHSMVKMPGSIHRKISERSRQPGCWWRTRHDVFHVHRGGTR